MNEGLYINELLVPRVGESALLKTPHLIVFIDSGANCVFAMNMASTNKPRKFSLDAIYDELEEGQLVKGVLDIPDYMALSDEFISAKDIKKRDLKYQVIKPIIDCLDDFLISNNYGKGLIQQCLLIAKEVGLKANRTQIYDFLYRFLKAGCNLNAFLRKPGTGKTINKVYTGKTGPKRDNKTIGRMRTDKDNKNIAAITRKYIFTPHPLSIHEAYQKYLDKYESDPVVDMSTGEITSFKRWDDELRLSETQFSNCVSSMKKKYKDKLLESQRKTDEFNKDVKGLTGNIDDYFGAGPGDVYQIDETPLAIELVDEFDPTRQKRMGPATCYSVIDMFSKVWVAIILTFAKASAHTAREVLFVAFRGKDKFFEEIGIKPRHPHSIEGKCKGIMLDNLEFASDLERSVSKDAHIEQIYNTEGNSQQKGGVERRHKTLEEFLFGMVPGVGKKHIADYLKRNLRKDALLNIRELYQLLYDFITTYNNFAVVEDMVITKEMKMDGVRKIPMDKFKWGLKNRPGFLKAVDENELYLNLLEVGQVTVHRGYLLLPGKYFASKKGQPSKGLKYTCEWTLENGIQDHEGGKLPRYSCRFMRYSLGIIYIETPDGLQPAHLHNVHKMYENSSAEMVHIYQKEQKVEDDKLKAVYQQEMSGVRLSASNLVQHAKSEKIPITANAANTQDLNANREAAIERERELSRKQLARVNAERGITVPHEPSDKTSKENETVPSTESSNKSTASLFADKMDARNKRLKGDK